MSDANEIVDTLNNTNMLHGLLLADYDSLNDADMQYILSNIITLANMARSLSEVIGLEPVNNETSNLAFTAAVLNELIANLACVLQEPSF